jgi:hypothetical protein
MQVPPASRSRRHPPRWRGKTRGKIIPDTAEENAARADQRVRHGGVEAGPASAAFRIWVERAPPICQGFAQPECPR